MSCKQCHHTPARDPPALRGARGAALAEFPRVGNGAVPAPGAAIRSSGGPRSAIKTVELTSPCTVFKVAALVYSLVQEHQSFEVFDPSFGTALQGSSLTQAT